MSRIVYISGPITDIKDGNIELFRSAAAEIKGMGLIVRNPHDFCADIPEGSSWEMYMRCCVIKLMECTDMVLLQGWNKSKGAWLEARLAKELKIEVHVSIRNFKKVIASEGQS